MAPNFVYTPAADYSGGDAFRFKISDGTAESEEAVLFITVNAVDDAPVAFDDSAATSKNTAVGIPVLANDRDAYGDALTVVSVSPASNGSAGIAPGGKSVTYTPKRNFRGDDTFSYTVSDGRGGTASATVRVTVGK